MRYFKPITFALMFLILAVVALCLAPGCASLQIGQPLQSYTFNYDGMSYTALLPTEVPLPPDNAQLYPQSYLGGIYAMHVWYMVGEKPEPRFPVTSFWFTKKLGVVALVHHKLKPDGSKKRIGWLYIKGLPIPTNEEGFEVFFDELAEKQ